LGRERSDRYSSQNLQYPFVCSDRYRRILAGEGQVFLHKDDMHAPLRQTQHDSPQVIEVAGQPVHRVTKHCIAPPGRSSATVGASARAAKAAPSPETESDGLEKAAGESGSPKDGEEDSSEE
jgi:hypothetical protein